MKREFVKLNVNGKWRVMTKYTEEDKHEQRCIYQAYKWVFTDNTSECAYAYVSGKSCWDAVNAVVKAIPNFKYFCKVDIADFFPSINDKTHNKIGKNSKE